MAIYQTQTEGRIYQLSEDSLKALGYEIVRIKSFPSGKRKTLQIMIERMDGKNISINDCEKVSRQLSAILDVENVIRQEYNLEVSSPGLNRPLTRAKDFSNAIGSIVKFILNHQIDGRRKYIGKITKVEKEDIEFEAIEPLKIINIKFSDIDEAFLQYQDSNIKSTATKRGVNNKQ